MTSSPCHVLLVDDSEADREVCRRHLAADQLQPYVFTDADTGAEGLALARGGQVDCLLLDYRLPDMDALEVLAELNQDEQLRTLPAVVLTGQGSETIAVSLMKAGAQDYLVKGSLDGETLRRSVRHAIEKGSLLRRLERHARDLAAANRGLTEEIERRLTVERDLQVLAADLERLVDSRTAELVRANRLKDEFMAAVSHELRTPLNAIVGWAQVLTAGPPSEELLAKALDTINRNARIQARLIDDLIDWSRIAAGQLRIEHAEVDLVGVVASAVDAVAPSAAAQGITIETCLPPSAPVSGDADRLKQAVWNLLSNAVKFTDAGGRIAVGLERRGGAHVVSVSDTGIGIAPGFLPKVFDPFRQADGSPTRRQGGLGLGLALTRQIMELHDGFATAESPGEGQGASFHLHVPVLADVPRSAPSVTPSPAVATPALDGRRVAIVDDDLDAREMLKTLLGQHGAVCDAFDGVGAALAGLPASRPDIVISDLAMPDQDGYTLLHHLKTHADPALRTVPVIAVTAFSGPQERQQALSNGFADHIGKPVIADRLLSAIHKALGSARSMPALDRPDDGRRPGRAS